MKTEWLKINQMVVSWNESEAHMGNRAAEQVIRKNITDMRNVIWQKGNTGLYYPPVEPITIEYLRRSNDKDKYTYLGKCEYNCKDIYPFFWRIRPVNCSYLCTWSCSEIDLYRDYTFTKSDQLVQQNYEKTWWFHVCFEISCVQVIL